MQNSIKYQASDTRYDKMVYKKCGNSGLLLPALSFGLWQNFGTDANYRDICKMCFTAFDNGITHFDLANIYGPSKGAAEENFGRILNEYMSAYRNEMVISTKVGVQMWDGPYGRGGSRKCIMTSIDDSLKRLKTDYVDIYYHHLMDSETPLYETMLAFNDVVKSGKALYIGLSNYDSETLKEASKILGDLNCPFIVNQNRYSILDRNIEKDGFIDALLSLEKGLVVYSPLAQGVLSGKYLNGIPKNSRVTKSDRIQSHGWLSDENVKRVENLKKLADERGQTLAQMSLAWVYTRPGVSSVLIGASRFEQIIENLKMLENVHFTKEELEFIDKNSQ